MPMLGFSPWIILDEVVDLGHFRFAPYLRGGAPFGPDTAAQRTADLLLEPCRGLADRPVRQAVLVQVVGREPFDVLPDEECQALLEAVELLAFSALASRDFFNFNTGAYCNRDHFAFYLQEFQDPASGARVVTRRRDGATINLLPRETYRIRAPEHVHSHTPRIDRQLLTALWSVRARASEWPHYFEAILGFNQANTDNRQVTEQAEAVAMVGAFERLYNLTRGKQDDLVAAVMPDLAWYPQLACDACRRARMPAERVGKPSGPTGEWLRDFFRSRGGWAHGRQDPTHPAKWSRREHLLLGAYVFPLVTKGKLRRDASFQPAPEDDLRLSILDRLVCLQELFVPNGQLEDDAKHPWLKVRFEGVVQQLMRGIDPGDWGVESSQPPETGGERLNAGPTAREDMADKDHA